MSPEIYNNHAVEMWALMEAWLRIDQEIRLYPFFTLDTLRRVVLYQLPSCEHLLRDGIGRTRLALSMMVGMTAWAGLVSFWSSKKAIFKLLHHFSWETRHPPSREPSSKSFLRRARFSSTRTDKSRKASAWRACSMRSTVHLLYLSEKYLMSWRYAEYHGWLIHLKKDIPPWCSSWLKRPKRTH